jgi:hypothetical protein
VPIVKVVPSSGWEGGPEVDAVVVGGGPKAEAVIVRCLEVEAVVVRGFESDVVVVGRGHEVEAMWW